MRSKLRNVSTVIKEWKVVISKQYERLDIDKLVNFKKKSIKREKEEEEARRERNKEKKANGEPVERGTRNPNRILDRY